MRNRQPSTFLLLIVVLMNSNMFVDGGSSAVRMVWSVPSLSRQLMSLRGGSLRAMEHVDNNEEDEEPQPATMSTALQKYSMNLQLLYQLRATILSEVLAKRGIPLVTMETVSTPEGTKPPELVDWDCAMSTEEEPKTCLYSFDAEPMTKVIAPINTDQWISLSALNRLRRTDPTKVEPMWHSQYTILQGWFGSQSPYSVGQHYHWTGLLLSYLLDHALVLRSLLGLFVALSCLIALPTLEWIVHKSLISKLFWNQWPTWGRIVHAALPLKLLLAQMAYKSLIQVLSKCENRVRDVLIDMECTMLEECMPLTVGPGSEVEVTEDDEVMEEE